MRLAWDIFLVRAIPFGPLFILIDLLFVHIYILLMRPIKLRDYEVVAVISSSAVII